MNDCRSFEKMVAAERELGLLNVKLRFRDPWKGDSEGGRYWFRVGLVTLDGWVSMLSVV
jgi:hypothetical protein